MLHLNLSHFLFFWLCSLTGIYKPMAWYCIFNLHIPITYGFMAFFYADWQTSNVAIFHWHIIKAGVDSICDFQKVKTKKVTANHSIFRGISLLPDRNFVSPYFNHISTFFLLHSRVSHKSSENSRSRCTVSSDKSL